MQTLWGLAFDDLEVAQAVNGLLALGSVVRETDGALELSRGERERLDAHAELSRANARLALEEWHEPSRRGFLPSRLASSRSSTESFKPS